MFCRFLGFRSNLGSAPGFVVFGPGIQMESPTIGRVGMHSQRLQDCAVLPFEQTVGYGYCITFVQSSVPELGERNNVAPARSGVAMLLAKPSFVEEKQFAFSKSELGKAAIYAEQEFRKYQDGRFVQIFQSCKMDVNLSIEPFLVVRSTCLTFHTTPRRSG